MVTDANIDAMSTRKSVTHALTILVLSMTTVQISAQSLPAASAEEIAKRVFDTAAGDAWEKARYISFAFAAERDGKVVTSIPQSYDRFTGDYRVAGKNREGVPYTVIMNVSTKAGRAWLDGKEVADPKALLESGYGRFINDTYWLLMPLKLRDPGSRLELAETKTDECGRTYDILKISFDQGIGLTSGDQYWMWVNRDTNLIDRWEMKLQGSKPEDPKRSFLFKRLQRSGGILLPTSKENAEGTSKILLNDFFVSDKVPAGAFAPPM